MIGALDVGVTSIWAAAIISSGGVLAAVITALVSVSKDSRNFQRLLVNRLLDREENILTPIVSSSENMQSAVTLIGNGVTELLAAQKIEEALRRSGRRDQ